MSLLCWGDSKRVFRCVYCVGGDSKRVFLCACCVGGDSKSALLCDWVIHVVYTSLY